MDQLEETLMVLVIVVEAQPGYGLCNYIPKQRMIVLSVTIKTTFSWFHYLRYGGLPANVTLKYMLVAVILSRVVQLTTYDVGLPQSDWSCDPNNAF